MKNRKSKQNSIPKLFLLLLALLMTGAVFNAKIMVAFAEGENITYEFTLTHTNTVPTTFSTVTFTTDGSYTLTDAAGSPYTDLDTVTPGIQVNTGAAFFDFKIVLTAENTVTGVSVAPVSPNVENANLYSPDADGVYRISNEKTTFDNGVKVITPCGNQTVTVTTAQTANITYDANGGAGTTPPTVSYEGESINLAWPADIGITPQTGYYFAGWNTQADGLGTSYTAGQTISVPSGGLTLYAQWNNTAAPFTAKLYDDNNYITYTELTEGGAVTNWVSTKQDRYLRIDANFTNGGTISITLPTGMALFDDNYTKQVGHATMANEPVFIPYDEDPNANGYQQGTGTYSNAKTGTLTYTFLTNANSDFMIIPVTFDQTIWDRSTGLANLSGDKPAITVAMTTGAGTGTTYTKALSKVLSSAGDGPFIYTDYWPDNVPIDDERVSMSYSSVRNADTYWRTLKMEYFLPQKTVNEADTGTYAEYIGESISSDTSWNGYTLVQTTANYTVDSSDPTKLIYTWTNHKQSNILYLSPVLYFPSGEFSNNDSLRFTVKLTGETYSGAVISKTKICTAKAVDKKAKVTINTSPKSIYQFNYPSEIRNILGSISLKNEGLIDSGKLKVTFTFDSANLAVSGNHNIDVSAFSLPQTNMTGLNPSTFSAECTMVNADNSVSFTHTMTSLSKHSSYTNNQYGRLLLASDVVTAYNTANPTNQVSGDWYFKTVTYEIPEIPHNSTLYYPTAQSAFDKLIPSGGNFYGRINAHATTTLDVKEWNKETSAWGDAITANIQSTKTSALTTTLYVGGVTFNGNSNSQTITAGDSLSMTVPLQLHSYPYGTTQYSQNPVFLFVAPVGVTIPSGGVSAAWSDSSQNPITTAMTSRSLESGGTVYMVEFNGTAAFGGPIIINGSINDLLERVDEARYPILTLSINTAAGMDASTLLLQNNLFVTEDGGNISINENFHKVDLDDLDNDNFKDDKLGKMSIAQSITITPNTNQLTFTAQAKMADEPDTSYRSDLNNTDTANRLYLSDESDRVNYRLTISNNSGSIVPAGNFMYYIPIPKSTIFDYHQFNGSPQFDLSLTGPVTITGNNPSVYDMRYSTDATGTNYNNGKADFNSTDGQATWLTAEQVNNNWSAVTMIKIIGAQTSGGYIPTGTVDNFTLSLSYSGVDTVLQNAGKSTSWGSCGIQKYKEDGTFNINGDHSPTKYVTVMLRSEVNREITLTAAEDMIPTSPAVKTDTIALPAYTLSETIKILSISTENVVLVPSIGITPTAADEASGATANGTFAITAKLADFTAYDLLAGVVSQELGSTTAGTPTNLTFTLYNYNALSDISTPRSVTVVLGDGEGVQITVKITIAREKASVTALTHIESGKSYQLMHGSSETVTITQDSAFTAQYVLNFIPDNYTGHTVSLHDSTGNNAVDFPVGTTLTLIDLKDTATPIYAYYKFTSAVSSVALSNFILMTNGTDSYHDRASDAGANPITEKLLLIVDFPDTENNIVAADTYKLKMTIESGSTPESIERTLILTDKRTFSLTSALTQNPTDNTLTAVAGTASTASGNPNDSRWLYRKMALVVTLSGNIGNTPFPEGAYIEMGGNRYVPSGNMIILPLGSLGEYDYTYTLATPHTRLDAGDYTLNTALYISATANDSSPMGGDKVDNKNTTFTVTAPSEYAIKLSISQDKHIFKKSELTANPNITLNIGYNAASASSAITLELQKKVGETYLTQTNLIEGASVGDDTFTVNGFGLIAISSRGSDAGYFDVTLTLKSSELTPGATYRILAKVSASGEKTQAVYNIVVVR